MPLDFVIQPEGIEAVHYYEESERINDWMTISKTQILSVISTNNEPGFTEPLYE